MDDGSTRYRFALWFSIRNDMCYLSHRDTLSFWQKALLRSRLSVKYSAGFNPHMRLSLPLPRSVGMVSDRELLLFELNDWMATEAVLKALSEQLPEDIAILEGDYVSSKLSLNACWADYRLRLTDVCDLNQLERKIETFRNSRECLIQRPTRGRHPKRIVDIRTQIESLELRDQAVYFRVLINSTATMRVSELCAYLGLNQPDDILEIRRLDVGYPELMMANV